jgi:membrane protein DedA with SNARE-associated domain/membrane-associated phospholipid phosphatase
MSAYVHDLLTYCASHPHMVGLVAFAASWLESLTIVGAVVPGSLVILGLGALVPAGAANLWSVIAWAIAGAVAGDGFSYWLGYRYRDSIRTWRPFRRHPGILERTEAFFRRHGGKSVFLGRFLQALRCTIPLVAGMAGMPPRRFLAANLSSALLWAPVTVLPGVVVGAAIGLAAGVSLRLLVLAVLVLSTTAIAVWGTRALLGRGVPRLAQALGAIETWALHDDSKPRRLLAAALGSVRQEGIIVVSLGCLAVLGFWIFFDVLEDVVSGDPLVRADTAVYHFLQGLRTTWADRIMVVVTGLGDGLVVTMVTIAALGWLAARRAWRAAAYLLAAMALATVFGKGLKALLHLPRPVPGLYTGWEAYTFPSGHATANAVLYGFLILLALPELGPRWRIPLIGVAATWIAAVGLSRLYLGAHWLADVLGGTAFALACVGLLGAVYLRHPGREVRAGGLLATAALTMAVLGGWHVATSYGAAIDHYAARQETRAMAAATWWRNGWRTLPAERIDLSGDEEEPLTLQWAGGQMALKSELEKAGWRTPTPWSATSALTWLASDPAPRTLPVLPKLNNGHEPELTLIHPAPGRARFVLRLWPSDVVLNSDEQHMPVWVGSVTLETMRSYLGIVTVTEPQPDIDASLRVLAAALRLERLAQRKVAAVSSDWQGQVLLATSGFTCHQAPDGRAQQADLGDPH